MGLELFLIDFGGDVLTAGGDDLTTAAVALRARCCSRAALCLRCRGERLGIDS